MIPGVRDPDAHFLQKIRLRRKPPDELLIIGQCRTRVKRTFPRKALPSDNQTIGRHLKNLLAERPGARNVTALQALARLLQFVSGGGRLEARGSEMRIMAANDIRGAACRRFERSAIMQR